ncbi:c-type cytochrome biogenesis protein CcmI [Pseudoduganella violacea]|uniref:Cytochrome c-type biogenesis protein CcmH n=1 Tax=Pseudoduganella violacea TaxID=1715466 RepID=A0A7W5FVL9_9BURK|nr:c-type cytochrome biogenesis protein CcmI [Pseudoduganella violacea]MBB3120952.1 cytochrome c-type biogenesis protein CcmH [Pseudoduganella violacea]
MSVFLIVTVLLTAATLLCILPPLLRQGRGRANGASPQQVNLAVLRAQMKELEIDRQNGTLPQAAHRAALRELERRVAEETQANPAPRAMPPQRWTALLLALLLPLGAAALYFQVGRPVAALPAVPPPTVVEQGHADDGGPDMNALVQGLAERLRHQPEDSDGWRMLARSYTALGRYREAAQAYSRLNTLQPNDADTLADYADALASAEDGKLAGQPERLIARALAIDPKHVKALALSGSAAFARADFAAAVRQWQALLPFVPPDSPFAESTRAGIATAQARLDGGPAQSNAARGRPASAPALSGTVRLAPGVQGVRPDDTLFIYARAAEGPRQPIAILRRQASDLPFDFTLDDSLAMQGGTPLSAHARVIVTARISRSGKAMPQAGDLEGDSAPLVPSAQGVQLEIGRRVAAAPPPHN